MQPFLTAYDDTATSRVLRWWDGQRPRAVHLAELLGDSGALETCHDVFHEPTRPDNVVRRLGSNLVGNVRRNLSHVGKIFLILSRVENLGNGVQNNEIRCELETTRTAVASSQE